MRIRNWLLTLMRIQILKLFDADPDSDPDFCFNADADPDPTFHPDVHPDPDPEILASK
jgi:hypothetical protein